MTSIDWSAIGLGIVAGAVGGALFFTGLALGLHQALRSTRPGVVLLVSAVLRIAAMAALGWLVVVRAGTVALLTFSLAFLVMRILAVALRRRLPAHLLAKPEAP
ncbi:hypothetical protein ACG33_12995 [Steroidobacter denitrificans]|uniref:ATP synthase subunit AtpR n=1 Tax=Steroidobacter denitrificans TaxID=465721 RepID=A0A127FE40_STEDE|nr:ATP synthase subunit I [Steroidobacter denitrificans]AMN47998.1 hypothetical protein ACG33_12995 [Steroidobacter denitrificans]